MIPTILITKFGPQVAKLIVYGGIVALLALAVGLFVWHERSIGAQSEVHKQDRREIKVNQDLGEAAGNAALKRVDDALNVQAQAQELKDATDNAISADDARVRRGCVVLRQQGRDTSGIAACR